MLDNRLIQGTLIGACLLLLFAFVSTLVDVNSFKGAASGAPMVSAPAPAQPEPTPAAPETETPAPEAPAPDAAAPAPAPASPE